MLLKQKPVFGYMGSVDAQLENARTLGHLVKPVKTCVENKMLAAKRYDLVAKIRSILSDDERGEQVKDSYTAINKIVSIIWLDNPHFLEDPSLYIDVIRDIGKVFYEPVYLKDHAHDLIYNQNDAIAFLPISVHMAQYESEIMTNSNGLMSAYRSLLRVSADLSKLDFDADLVYSGAQFITFSDLLSMSDSAKHIEAIRTIMDKPAIQKKFTEDIDADVYGEASKSTLHFGLTALYDIWYNTSTLGKQNICDIYRLNLEIHKEDMLTAIVSNIQDGAHNSPYYVSLYDELGLLAKNMMIECRKFASQHFINALDLEKKIEVMINHIMMLIAAFQKISDEEINDTYYHNICLALFKTIVQSIPELSHVHEIMETKFVNALFHEKRQYQFNDKLSYSDILLGIYEPFDEDDDDAPATEASNAIKADGTARVSDANMKKDTARRGADGRYQRQTKDIKSVGLSIANGFKTFNDHRKDIEKSVDKGWNALKDIFFGSKEVRTAVVEGKRFSITGLLKKLIALPAVFALGPLQGGLLLIIRAIGRGKIKKEERRKMELAIKEELTLLEEKIQDASSDGDRKAKYAMMRSKAQLENALQRIKYGYEADESPAVKQLMGSEG